MANAVKKKNENDQLTFAGTEEGEILARLASRVEAAVRTIQELRRERDELKKRIETMEADLAQSTGATERLEEIESENDRFKNERVEIRTRIETILGNLESLEEAE